MIKVLALTSGAQVPSTRFRIRQYVEGLLDLGIDVEEMWPRIDKGSVLRMAPSGMRVRYLPYAYPVWMGYELTKIALLLPALLRANRSYHATWLSRGLHPGMPTFEKLLKRPIVLDVDDAVWSAQPFGRGQMALTAKLSARIVVGNQYLANWFSDYNSNIEIIPTAVDAERFRPREKARADDTFVVGWTGTGGNFKYLAEISEGLRRFLEEVPSAQLRIVADRPPLNLDIPPDRIDFVEWSPANEAESVRGMDVGIMPLADNPWTRGKCSLKMIQYMACGLPVVVSPVGMNDEILAKGRVGIGARTNSDWCEALLHYYRNRCEATRDGAEGRRLVENFYSKKRVLARLAHIFNEVLQA